MFLYNPSVKCGNQQKHELLLEKNTISKYFCLHMLGVHIYAFRDKT